MFDGVQEDNYDEFRAFGQWSAFPKGVLGELETYEVETEEGQETSPALQDMPQFLAQFLDDGCRANLGLPSLGDLRDRGDLEEKIPRTMSEIAAVLGVSSRTLYKWKKLDSFKQYVERFMNDWAGMARQRIKMRSLHEAETTPEAGKEREAWLKTFGDMSDEKTINVSGEIDHNVQVEDAHTVNEQQLLEYALHELRQDPEVQDLPLPVVKTMLNKIVRMVMGQGLSQDVLDQVDQDALLTPEEINENGGREFLLGDGTNNNQDLE